MRLAACLAMLAAGLAFATRDSLGRDDATPVTTGAQELAKTGFAMLAGRRVGLIANHTSLAGKAHLADLLHAAPGVTLAALFAPEHGFRGLAAANEKIANSRDPRTGVRIYSLYGATRAPTPAMLRGIDILVFDLQDVGARFYTYISTMGLAMQAAARAGIPFVVLDRPNPLGGLYVAGFAVERPHISFVGQYAIPLAHGMTAGELARMIKGKRLMEGLEALELEVVAMTGWRRDMLWPDTGLPWVAPSPNIPDFETALVYPGVALFEATTASEGRGTDMPFRLIGAPWADAGALAAALNAAGLAGVRFEPASFTPKGQREDSQPPKLAGRALQGVRIRITDARDFRPVETGVHLLHAFRAQARARRAGLVDRADALARLAGTTRLHGMLRRGLPPQRIISAWGEEARAFRRARAPYLLYP